MSATANEDRHTNLLGGTAHAGAILDATLDAVITIDHLGYVLEFNRAAEATFGYPRDEVLGRELAVLIVPPQHREAHRHALGRWSEDGPGPGAGALLGRRIEIEAMRADGSIFPAELAITTVDVPGPPLFTACVRDRSDRAEAEQRLREAEFRFRMLVEQLPLVSYVDSPDNPVSAPRYLSPQIEDLLGRSPEEWLSTPGLYERSIHPDDRERVVAEKRLAYERGEALRCEYRMLAADGRTIWVEDQSVLVRPPDGAPSFRQGFAIDVTDRRLAGETLRAVEGRYRTLVEQLPLTVYVDAVDERSSNIYTSPQIEPLLGYTTEEWLADPDLFVKLLHPADRERVLAVHARTHATGEPLSVEYRLIARDGRVVWVLDEARIIDDLASGRVLQGYLLDVTARKEAEEQLRHQAFHDPLTGLANRALFTDRVQHALVLAGGGGGTAVFFVDLDDFKAMNDRLGHPAGDALLSAVGARLVEVLSPSHTVARLGGDEFAILVEGVRDAAAAAAEADRLVGALQQPFDVAGHEVFVTASIGIAMGGDAAELLRSADVAMYRAKASGKAQYAFYAPTMDEEVLGRLELIADLRRARPGEQFTLRYQPSLDLQTGRIEGVEALLRWEHPRLGTLQPASFIWAAEETGLIVELGRWVLNEACRTAAVWRAQKPAAATLGLSVNVSARQLQEPSLVDDVREALAASGLEPSALTLEITESVLAERGDTAILDAVKALGVRISLDDFGTGYSSLSRLQYLPVDELKIDRSFVQSIESGVDRAALVRAIVELGRALGLSTVAEGIEHVGQVAVLKQVGCRLGQGYHFARPLAADELGALLARSAPGEAA